MFKPERIFSTALATSLLLAAADGRAMSGEYDNTQRRNLINRLHGTTWCAPNVHQRVSVDLNGLVTTKEGKDICLAITQHTGAGALVMKVIWWNVAAGIHVEEWAVALPTGKNSATYREAEHPANSNFPGIIGNGELRLTREGTLELHQIGQLADGSAAAFLTTLKQVNALPQIPLKRTYPKQ